jgi:hypothetical protein
MEWTFHQFKVARVYAKQAQIQFVILRRKIYRRLLNAIAIRLNHTDASCQTLPITGCQNRQTLFRKAHFRVQREYIAHGALFTGNPEGFQVQGILCRTLILYGRHHKTVPV